MIDDEFAIPSKLHEGVQLSPVRGGGEYVDVDRARRLLDWQFVTEDGWRYEIEPAGRAIVLAVALAVASPTGRK